MDERTIQAARKGDRTALTVLLRELQDPWFRFTVSLLQDREQAQDATQETGLRFLKLVSTFRGESQLQTWSMGIALNVVREMRRRNRPTTELDGDLLAESVDSSLAGPRAPTAPFAVAEHAERREYLARAMAGLSDRQREAVVLRFFEGMSVEQTAAVMNCAEGTVKATVHQALRAMRQRLPESWADEQRPSGGKRGAS